MQTSSYYRARARANRWWMRVDAIWAIAGVALAVGFHNWASLGFLAITGVMSGLSNSHRKMARQYDDWAGQAGVKP